MARAASNNSVEGLSCESPKRSLDGDDAKDAPIDDLQGLGIDADQADEESKQAVEQPVEASTPVDNWRQPGPVP